MAPDGAAYPLLTAYCKWVGVLPFSTTLSRGAPGNLPKHKVSCDDVDLSRPVELVVLAVNRRLGQAHHCAWAAPDAQASLVKMLEADLRCLDAHAHLGNILARRSPQWALSHYEVGVRIGYLSLGDDFDGVLAWGLLDNRPFLRCLHGYGLCLWRLDRWQEAERVLERMLWLNPSDHQGVRGVLPEVRAREAWVDDEI